MTTGAKSPKLNLSAYAALKRRSSTVAPAFVLRSLFAVVSCAPCFGAFIQISAYPECVSMPGTGYPRGFDPSALAWLREHFLGRAVRLRRECFCGESGRARGLRKLEDAETLFA